MTAIIEGLAIIAISMIVVFVALKLLEMFKGD
jgi:hypothetical protein